MAGTLIEVTLGETANGAAERSFNNDVATDAVRNSFSDVMEPSNLLGDRDRVPQEYLHPNVYHYDSRDAIDLLGKDKILVGMYCNHGIVVPAVYDIIFSRLFHCAPLISILKGDEEQIAFLHAWTVSRHPEILDGQVKHWMKTISGLGEVSETIFAPRKNSVVGDTDYEKALDYICETSRKTIVLNRRIQELKGVVNKNGTYFQEGGYHLWE